LRLALVVSSLATTAPAVLAQPTVAGCQVFPADNVWNTRIDHLPVDPMSDAYVATIGADTRAQADFGAGLYEGRPIGIPFAVVPPDQREVEVHLEAYADEPAIPDESDGGLYAIPRDAPIEGGVDGDGDRHVIVVQEQSCTLYELYKVLPNEDGSWNAVASVKFDLESNAMRPAGWTSADAAGLPIFPGLVRYDEVAAGEIAHALRFTAPVTRNDYVWPARHEASDADDPSLPPMGQRFRLKADFDISGFAPEVQVILTALKTYGMILSDNGSPWFITGVPDDRWDNEMLFDAFAQIHGSDFEAVDSSSLIVDPDSAQAAQ
jgi:hypothetical protein